MWRSVPQTPQAAMRMSAALGGTSGFGTSRRTGGSPGPSKVATRTFGMDPPNDKRKGASTALPRAATVIRGKIHNGYNPVNPLRRAMASRRIRPSCAHHGAAALIVFGMQEPSHRPAAPRADAERACARGPSKDQGAFISIGEGCVGTSIVAKAQDTNTKNVLFYASSAQRKLRGRRRVG